MLCNIYFSKVIECVCVCVCHFIKNLEIVGVLRKRIRNEGNTEMKGYARWFRHVKRMSSIKKYI